MLGDLRLPAFWPGEIFADLALHTFVATRRPESLNTLKELSFHAADPLSSGEVTTSSLARC